MNRLGHSSGVRRWSGPPGWCGCHDGRRGLDVAVTALRCKRFRAPARGSRRHGAAPFCGKTPWIYCASKGVSSAHENDFKAPGPDGRHRALAERFRLGCRPGRHHRRVHRAHPGADSGRPGCGRGRRPAGETAGRCTDRAQRGAPRRSRGSAAGSGRCAGLPLSFRDRRSCRRAADRQRRADPPADRGRIGHRAAVTELPAPQRWPPRGRAVHQRRRCRCAAAAGHRFAPGRTGRAAGRGERRCGHHRRVRSVARRAGSQRELLQRWLPVGHLGGDQAAHP